MYVSRQAIKKKKTEQNIFYTKQNKRQQRHNHFWDDDWRRKAQRQDCWSQWNWQAFSLCQYRSTKEMSRQTGSDMAILLRYHVN